jgi:hypothetical protein
VVLGLVLRRNELGKKDFRKVLRSFKNFKTDNAGRINRLGGERRKGCMTGADDAGVVRLL